MTKTTDQKAKPVSSPERDGQGRFLARAQANHTPTSSWTADKRLAFLAALASTSNVSKSAKAVRISESQVYAERRRNAVFREAWKDALSEGYARLEFMMLERASAAFTVKDEATDETVATNKMHEYSNKLALNLLTAHRATVRETRGAGLAVRPRSNGVAGSRARLVDKLDEMRARGGG